MLAIVVAWVTIFGPAQPRPVPQGGRLGRLLRQQLAADLRQRLLLRPLRARRPAQPPLVALGRGAVLHRLAVPAAARGQARPRAAAALRACARGWPSLTIALRARLGDPDGGPLRAEPRPLAGLLRHRHPRLRAALRRGAGDGLAEPPTQPPDRAAGAATRSTALGVAGLAIIALMIWQVGEFSPFLYRGGFVDPLAGDGDGADAADPPGLPPRRLARDAAAALGRRPLLRDLPLADPGDRPHHAAGSRTTTASLARRSSRWRRSSPSPALSWRFVEEPIRHGAIGRFFARRRAVGWKWEALRPADAGSDRRHGHRPRGRRRRHGRPQLELGRRQRRPGRAGARRRDHEAAATDQGTGRRLDQIVLQSRRPHRRLDLRGPRRRRIPADRNRSGSPPATPQSGPKKSTWK